MPPCRSDRNRPTTRSPFQMSSPKRPFKRLPTSGMCAPGAKRTKGHPNSQSPRPRRACDQCRQRKAKCDNQKPCGRCVAWKIPCSLDEGTSLQPFFHAQTNKSIQDALNSSIVDGGSMSLKAATASKVNDEPSRQKSELAGERTGLEAQARRSAPGEVQLRLNVVLREDQNNEFAEKQEEFLATCEALKRQKTELLEKCDAFTSELEALRSQQDTLMGNHEILLAELEGLKRQKDEAVRAHLELLQSKIQNLGGEYKVESLERRNTELLRDNTLLQEERAQKRQQEAPRHSAVKGAIWHDSAPTKYMPTRQPMETAPFNPYLTGGQPLMENTTAPPAYPNFPPLSNHSVGPQDWSHQEGATNSFYQWRMT